MRYLYKYDYQCLVFCEKQLRERTLIQVSLRHVSLSDPLSEDQAHSLGHISAGKRAGIKAGMLSSKLCPEILTHLSARNICLFATHVFRIVRNKIQLESCNSK